MPDEKRATNLEEVWNNFRPDVALEPDSIFRIERHDSQRQIAPRALQRALPDGYEKWFLMGHRGCSKSIYLKYLLSLEHVTAKFYPIRYRISDVADTNDLDYQELLFSVAAVLVEEALARAAIQPKLKERLENWGATLVKETTRAEEAKAEVEGVLKAYFMGFLTKLQTQYSTRRQFRKTIEPQLAISAAKPMISGTLVLPIVF